MEQTIKPFDILSKAKGKEITVALKNEIVYRGKLKAFDIHLNLVLFDAVELINKKEENIGSIVIRGDAIVTIKNI
jgi:small nuclear ribonucleoprotein